MRLLKLWKFIVKDIVTTQTASERILLVTSGHELLVQCELFNIMKLVGSLIEEYIHIKYSELIVCEQGWAENIARNMRFFNEITETMKIHSK